MCVPWRRPWTRLVLVKQRRRRTPTARAARERSAIDCDATLIVACCDVLRHIDISGIFRQWRDYGVRRARGKKLDQSRHRSSLILATSDCTFAYVSVNITIFYSLLVYYTAYLDR